MRARMASSIREVERMANRVAASSAITSPLGDALAGLAIAAVIFYGSGASPSATPIPALSSLSLPRC